MPELINEGSVKKPLLVGAADPYEFIAEHAADAAYWSDVAREAAKIPDDALLAYATRSGGLRPCLRRRGERHAGRKRRGRPMNAPTTLLAEAPVDWRRARDQEETAPGEITSERPLPLTASIGRSAPYPIDGLLDVLGDAGRGDRSRQANTVGRRLLAPHGQPAVFQTRRGKDEDQEMRIVQIAATRDINGREQLYALTDKGEVWLHNEHEWSWDELPPLPTDDNVAVEDDAS